MFNTLAAESAEINPRVRLKVHRCLIILFGLLEDMCKRMQFVGLPFRVARGRKGLLGLLQGKNLSTMATYETY